MDESMHKSAVLRDAGGGGKDGNEAVMEVSTNNLGPIATMNGMATLSMEVSMVVMALSCVFEPYRSWQVNFSTVTIFLSLGNIIRKKMVDATDLIEYMKLRLRRRL